jgi:hypothetical protein
MCLMRFRAELRDDYQAPLRTVYNELYRELGIIVYR